MSECVRTRVSSRVCDCIVVKEFKMPCEGVQEC